MIDVNQIIKLAREAKRIINFFLDENDETTSILKEINIKLDLLKISEYKGILMTLEEINLGSKDSVQVLQSSLIKLNSIKAYFTSLQVSNLNLLIETPQTIKDFTKKRSYYGKLLTKYYYHSDLLLRTDLLKIIIKTSFVAIN